MISSASKELLKNVVTIGHFFCCIPIAWNRRKRKFQPSKWRLVIFIWHLTLLTNTVSRLVMVSVMGYNMTTTRSMSVLTIGMGIEMCAFILGTLSVNLLILTKTSDWRDGVKLLNDIFAVHERLRKEYGLKFAQRRDKVAPFLQKFIIVALMTLASYPPLTLGLFELMPDLFRYLKTDYFILNLVLALAAPCSLAVDAVFAIILTSAILIYLKSASFWLRRITRGPLAHQRRQFRALHLLHGRLTSFGAPFTPSLGLACLIMIISLTFVGVKQSALKNFCLSCVLCSFSAGILWAGNFCADAIWDTTKASMKYSKSWKHANREHAAFLRSCQPFKFPIGSLFSFQLDFYLIAINFILQQVINLLLSF